MSAGTVYNCFNADQLEMSKKLELNQQIFLQSCRCVLNMLFEAENESYKFPEAEIPFSKIFICQSCKETCQNHYQRRNQITYWLEKVFQNEELCLLL